MTFDQPVPGVAAAPVTPSWVQPQPQPRSVADSVPRAPRPRQPLPPIEAPPLFEAKPPTVTPPSRRRKKRLIAAALALVVAGLLFTGAYNVWDTVFPPHSMPGYDHPTSAQVQAAFGTDIPVTPAAPAAAPVQQSAAPPPPVVLVPQQTYAEVPGGQTPDASSANSAAPQSGFVPTEQSPERHYQSADQETACSEAPQAQNDIEESTRQLNQHRDHLDSEEVTLKNDQDELRDNGDGWSPDEIRASEDDITRVEEDCKSAQEAVDNDLQTIEAKRLIIAQCGGQ